MPEGDSDLQHRAHDARGTSRRCGSPASRTSQTLHSSLLHQPRPFVSSVCSPAHTMSCGAVRPRQKTGYFFTVACLVAPDPHRHARRPAMGTRHHFDCCSSFRRTSSTTSPGRRPGGSVTRAPNLAPLPGARAPRRDRPMLAAGSTGTKRRTIYDARHGTQTARAAGPQRGGAASADARSKRPTTARATRTTSTGSIFQRNSIDDAGHAARRDGPLRPRLRQRLLGRSADGLRRRRRRAVQPLHHLARRHRPRADPWRHRGRGRPGLHGPVGRAERVDLGRVRLAGQAVRRSTRPPTRPTG